MRFDRIGLEPTRHGAAELSSERGGGWEEPGQTPEFDEYTVVLRGMLRVASKDGTVDIHAGQAVIVHKGESVQYSTPEPEGAEYIAVCLPAFSMAMVHRDG